MSTPIPPIHGNIFRTKITQSYPLRISARSEYRSLASPPAWKIVLSLLSLIFGSVNIIQFLYLSYNSLVTLSTVTSKLQPYQQPNVIDLDAFSNADRHFCLCLDPV